MRPIQLLLALLAISTVVGFVVTQSTIGIYESTGLIRGWDFQQFYLAGKFVAQGREADLYSMDEFQAAQRALLPVDDQNIPFVPLYPPMIAILVAPLARLSYLPALLLWWGVGVSSYVGACWLLLKSVRRRYRSIAILAMCGFFPLFVALRAGQLTPLLLLVAVVGLRYRNGLVLSLLVLKPQFACGMLAYFLVRRQWKLCGTMVLGCLAQLAMVSVTLGPQVLIDYLSFARIYAHHSQMYSFPDGWVHSISGMTGPLVHIVVVALLAVYLGTVRRLPWAMESALAT